MKRMMTSITVALFGAGIVLSGCTGEDVEATDVENGTTEAVVAVENVPDWAEHQVGENLGGSFTGSVVCKTNDPESALAMPVSVEDVGATIEAKDGDLVVSFGDVVPNGAIINGPTGWVLATFDSSASTQRIDGEMIIGDGTDEIDSYLFPDMVRVCS